MKSRSLPSSSMIIATMNRPKELEEALGSILEQTVRPDEILVIDDGELVEFPLEDDCRDVGIASSLHRKAERGLTASRNLGVKLAHGEIILFIDDDVILKPRYIESVLSLFAADTEGILGGVGGVDDIYPADLSLAKRIRHWLDIIFLNSGFREGRVLCSGFCVDYGDTGRPIREVTKVDFLPGAAFSFRREVFEKHSFSERYRGYGLGEDKDFSYRVGRDYQLLASPDARLDHLKSPVMRWSKAKMGRKSVLVKYRFFVETFSTSRWQWICFSYALLGYFLIRIGIMLLSLDRVEFARVRNMLLALRDILRGDIDT